MNTTPEFKTEHTFKSEYAAVEAASYLNSLPGNNTVVAFRDKCKVWLRPEYTTPRTIKNLADMVHDCDC